MGRLTDFLDARATRTNPAYAQQQALLEQRQYDQQQANKMAAAARHIYGDKDMQTKMYDPNISEQNRFTGTQQRMMASGLPGLQKQQATNLTQLQNSAMSNQGQMARHLTRSADFKPTMTTIGVEGNPKGRQQAESHGGGRYTPVGPSYESGGGIDINTGDTPEDWTQQYNEDTWASLEPQRSKWNSAVTDIESLQYTKDLLDQSYSTGPLDIIADPVRRLASQLGMDFDKQATTDQLRGQLGDFAMERIQDTKGSVSDAEMAYFQRISPNMTNTKEGNQLIIQLLIDRATRDGEIGKIARQMQQKGATPLEIEKMANRYVKANPLDLAPIQNFEAPEAPVEHKQSITRHGVVYEFAGMNEEGEPTYLPVGE